MARLTHRFVSGLAVLSLVFAVSSAHAICGDTIPDVGEICDDGNVIDGDGCDSNCTLTGCGNGIPTLSEACDDGNGTSGDGCDVNCTITACGNGVVTAPEVCDDGNLTNGDGCDANCTNTACGNGIVTAPETCDDSNLVNNDGCDANCSPTACGNGITTAGEACDDGNLVSGDGCDADCSVTACGNGILTAGETCDDHNVVPGDGCRANCTIEICGDTIVDTAAGETCDDGNAVSGDGCDANCKPTGCQNGVVTVGEQCDDQNAVNGDGCSSTCQREILNPVPAAGSQFGQSVAVSGSNVIVGVPLHDQVDALDTGLAYLFSGTTGALVRTFHNPTPDPGDQFGFAVAAVGSLIVVGCPLDDALGPDTGVAYLFDSATGNLLRTFANPNPTGNRHFGWSVAAFGSNVLIGAPLDSTGAQGGGIAYLYHSGTGSLLQVFLNPTPDADDNFGAAIAGVAGTNVIVGAPGHDRPAQGFDPAAPDAGAAYVFSAATGMLIHTLLPPQAFPGDGFGFSVAGLGSNLLVGAPLSDLTRKDGGTLYVFNGATGALTRTIQKPAPLVDEQFAFAITTVGGSKILAGAPGVKLGSALNAGAAYLFDSGTGALLQTLQKPTPAVGDAYGRAVAASGSQILVGAPLDDISGVNAGAVYYATDSSCGNGVLNSGEICDDGNTTAGDGCDPNCTNSACGNGVVGPTEQCDDGNVTAGDGCSATCTLEGVCGNGAVTAPEQCDDGNVVNGDGCDNNCTVSGCGNGIITSGEACDDGANNGVDLCCSVSCQPLDNDGDGFCDRDDVCPTVSDPSQTNADGDIFGDACDLCPADADNDSDHDGFCVGELFNPPMMGGSDPCSRMDAGGQLIKPNVLAGHLGPPFGDEKLRIRARLKLGSEVPIVAPHVNGVHVRVTNRTGEIILDEVIPGGLFSNATRRGWKLSSTSWSYKDKSNVSLHNGITGLLIKNLAQAEPLLYAVNIQGKDGNYPLIPGEEPVTVSIEFNEAALPPGGTPGFNQCAETTFNEPPASPSCTSKPRKVRCY